MLKKILIAVGCLVLAIAVHGVWSAYSAKRRFEAVMADYAHDQGRQPAAAASSARRN